MTTPYITGTEAATRLGLLVNITSDSARRARVCQMRRALADTGRLTMERRGRACLYLLHEVESLLKDIRKGRIHMDIQGRITSAN